MDTVSKLIPADRFTAGLAALEHQAAAARAALPHFALIERTRAAWLPALDVATDAGDLEQLARLVAEAPTEFALGLASARSAGLQGGLSPCGPSASTTPRVTANLLRAKTGSSRADPPLAQSRGR